MRQGSHIQILPDRKIVAINMKTGDEASVAHVFILYTIIYTIQYNRCQSGPGVTVMINLQKSLTCFCCAVLLLLANEFPSLDFEISTKVYISFGTM